MLNKDLIEFNNLRNSNIRVGQVIKIPATQPDNKLEQNKPDKIQKSSIQITHTVKNSETLYAIAKMHGSDVEKIKARNNLKVNSLKPGQKLIIPSKDDEPNLSPGNLLKQINLEFS